MSDPWEDADIGLREGLRSLPVPETSADFAARIHAELRQPVPWWKTLWTTARPLLSGAVCSLVVTMILLPRLVHMPSGPPSHSESTVVSEVAMDRVLDSTELSAASLTRLRLRKRLSTAIVPPLPPASMRRPQRPGPDHSSRLPQDPTV
jgi:hypothetical protein